MADLSVDVNLITPRQIDVKLVRADQLRVSNQFRAVFEAALAVFAAVLGAVFCGEVLGVFGWGLLILSGVATGGFAWLAVRWKGQAVVDTDG